MSSQDKDTKLIIRGRLSDCQAKYTRHYPFRKGYLTSKAESRITVCKASIVLNLSFWVKPLCDIG